MFVPKLIMQAVFSIIFTMVYSLIILTVFIILFCLTVVFGPLALFALTCEVIGCKRYVLIFLMVVFYPLMNALFFIGMTILVLLYPYFRTTYHHGIYDPVDSGLSTTSYIYMSVIEAIWSFWLGEKGSRVCYLFLVCFIVSVICFCLSFWIKTR